MQYKISICIPTYNREKYLKDALDSIVNQLDDTIKDMVEICVSDNASLDNTEELVKGYKKFTPNIAYFRWNKNMGADLNILKVVEIAHGKYCWFLGSDDILEPTALKVMLEDIDKNPQINIFCINNNSYDINLQNKSIPKHAMYKHKTNIIFNNTYDCIKSMGSMFGYLSCLVFKKSLWDKYAVEKKFIGSAYPHIYILFSILKNYNGQAKYISNALIGYRRDNSPFLLEVGVVKRLSYDVIAYNDITADVFGKNSKELKVLNHYVINHYIFMSILYSLTNNQADFDYRWKLLNLTYKYYRSYLSFWFKIFPPLITPRSIMLIIKFFYRLFIKNFISLNEIVDRF
jgi:abequosyltransferase